MNNHRLGSLAAVVAGLLTIWALPSTAFASCEKLGAAMFGYNWSGKGVNPMKPVNMRGEGSYTLRVYWDAPSSRPAGTVSGMCVHIRHVDTGKHAEFCRADTSIEFGTYGCLGNAAYQSNCPLGAYSIKVRMQNSCGLLEDYSDPIFATRARTASGQIWRDN